MGYDNIIEDYHRLEAENKILSAKLNKVDKNLENARRIKRQQSIQIYLYIIEQRKQGVRKRNLLGTTYNNTLITEKRYINAMKYEKEITRKVED